jgi:hypothetical protein
MPTPADAPDLDAIRRELEARRDVTRDRIAVLAARPERARSGSASGSGTAPSRP